jgi:hypothetical protein
MSDFGAARARRAQQAVNALGAGVPDPAAEVLEPFEDEVRERDAIWSAGAEVPRMETRRHRDGSVTKVLVRSDTSPEARAVTIHFTDREWSLLTRAVLAGLGLQQATS